MIWQPPVILSDRLFANFSSQVCQKQATIGQTTSIPVHVWISDQICIWHISNSLMLSWKKSDPARYAMVSATTEDRYAISYNLTRNRNLHCPADRCLLCLWWEPDKFLFDPFSLRSATVSSHTVHNITSGRWKSKPNMTIVLQTIHQ